MKGIVITPDGGTSVQDFAEPLYKTVGAVVGGLIQVVRPQGLPEPFRMVVNEEGRLKKLPFHPVASFWYGTQTQPIVGTVVLLKEALNDEREPDLFGLDGADVCILMGVIEKAKASRLPKEPKNPPPAVLAIEIPPDADCGKRQRPVAHQHADYPARRKPRR